MSEEDRDVLWASIGELQKVNQKLMSDLRAAQANNQKAVDDANNTEWAVGVIVSFAFICFFFIFFIHLSILLYPHSFGFERLRDLLKCIVFYFELIRTYFCLY